MELDSSFSPNGIFLPSAQAEELLNQMTVEEWNKEIEGPWREYRATHPDAHAQVQLQKAASRLLAERIIEALAEEKKGP